MYRHCEPFLQASALEKAWQSPVSGDCRGFLTLNLPGSLAKTYFDGFQGV